MNANIQHLSNSTARGNYVLLTADTLHLLLPQQEVGAAEHLGGLLEAADEAGLLKLPGEKDTRRFAALSPQMTLLRHCPSERFLATTIGNGNDDLRWCWNELQILIDVELRFEPLPALLLAPDTPVAQYAELDGKLAYLCSARQLCAYALASRN